MSFLSINAYAPVIQQPANSYHERLQTEGEQYTISVDRGFDTAGFVLRGSYAYLDSWYKNGLARDITWRGPDGYICWSGFVSKLAYIVGGVTRSRSLEAVANRIIIVYDQLNTATNPPASQGQQIVTVNSTVSQAAFGIKTVVISGGESTASAATSEANARLARFAFPPVGETQVTGKGEAPTLQVEMQGYSYMADWFVYNQTASSGTDDADDIIGLVLAADPNGILSTSTKDIDTNTLAVPQYWQNQPGWKMIDTITRLGGSVDGSSVPWVSGVYARRRLVYKAAEGLNSSGNPLSSNKHQRIDKQISSSRDIYVTEGGAEVPYWHMRPDRLIYTIGLSSQQPLYVSKVSYTPPVALQLAGDDLQQPLRGVVRV